MKYFIKVKPNAKQEKTLVLDSSHLQVWVKDPPEAGRANKAVEEVLADFCGVAKSRVRVVKGFSARNKIVEVL